MGADQIDRLPTGAVKSSDSKTTGRVVRHRPGERYREHLAKLRELPPVLPLEAAEPEPEPASPAEPRDWRHHPAEPEPAPDVFAKVPMKLVRDLELDPAAVRMFAELAGQAWREPVLYRGDLAHRINGGITYAQLGANIGRSRRQAIRLLEALEEAGYLTVEPIGGALVVHVFGLGPA